MGRTITKCQKARHWAAVVRIGSNSSKRHKITWFIGNTNPHSLTWSASRQDVFLMVSFLGEKLSWWFFFFLVHFPLKQLAMASIWSKVLLYIVGYFVDYRTNWHQFFILWILICGKSVLIYSVLVYSLLGFLPHSLAVLFYRKYCRTSASHISVLLAVAQLLGVLTCVGWVSLFILFIWGREKQSFPLFVVLLYSYLGSTERSDYTGLFLLLCCFYLHELGMDPRVRG